MKKLSLNKETIAILNSDMMNRVKGGDDPPRTGGLECAPTEQITQCNPATCMVTEPACWGTCDGCGPTLPYC